MHICAEMWKFGCVHSHPHSSLCAVAQIGNRFALALAAEADYTGTGSGTGSSHCDAPLVML